MGIMDNVYVKRTCPKCIEEFYPGDCDIVSETDPNTILKAAPKSGLKKHYARINPEPITGKLVLALGHRKCVHCGYLLPTNIEQVMSLSIAIVGDPFSGKSHYIGALIKQIENGELQSADRLARLDCMTQNVEQEYVRDIIKPLFEDKQVVGATQPAVDTNRDPLIYELTLQPSAEHPERHINLILYDASGEDFVLKQNMVKVGRYIFSADAIIFLIDPLSISNIYDQLPPFLQKRHATGRKPVAILNSVIRLIEEYQRDSNSGRRLRETPIAVTVAKSDLLKQLTSVKKQYHFLKRPDYNGIVDLEDLQTVDQEVRQLLETYNERTLLQTTQNLRAQFFATSATGYAPNADDTYPAIDPCRCLDPILWILSQREILHAA